MVVLIRSFHRKITRNRWVSGRGCSHQIFVIGVVCARVKLMDTVCTMDYNAINAYRRRGLGVKYLQLMRCLCRAGWTRSSGFVYILGVLRLGVLGAKDV